MPETKSTYLEIEPGLDLYIEETGEGRPLVFIPGWTMTTEVFAKQVAHFSKAYRVITYDPRCHGRSGKTLRGVNYPQHGRDLATVIRRLELEEPVLVPWSYGCTKVWELIRQNGTDGLTGVVWIDLSPQQIERATGDWAEGVIDDVLGMQRDLTDQYRAATRAFCEAMWQGDAPPEELDWVVSESLKTPQYAALLMTADGMTRDETDLAIATDGAVPMLHVVHEDKGLAAQAFADRHCPSAKVVPLGYHFMFWEFADRFNAVVDSFLKEHKL